MNVTTGPSKPTTAAPQTEREAADADLAAQAELLLTPRAMAWRRFRGHRLAVVGAIFLILLIIVVVFGPLVYQVDPNAVDPRQFREPPSGEHPLGTDSAGRDVLARLFAGGRVSVLVGVVATAVATTIGLALGALAGFLRGGVDATLSRVFEILQSFPTIVLLMALGAFLGPSIWMLIVVIGLMEWTTTFRVVRALTMSLREQDMIWGIRGLGAGPVRILVGHIFPNVFGALVVAATLMIAGVILMETTLSFLGLGVPPPTASWGNMLNEAQSLSILESMPWLWMPPGFVIAATVLAVNFVGEGLRDALDPRLAT